MRRRIESGRQKRQIEWRRCASWSEKEILMLMIKCMNFSEIYNNIIMHCIHGNFYVYKYVGRGFIAFCKLKMRTWCAVGSLLMLLPISLSLSPSLSYMHCTSWYLIFDARLVFVVSMDHVLCEVHALNNIHYNIIIDHFLQLFAEHSVLPIYFCFLFMLFHSLFPVPRARFLSLSLSFMDSSCVRLFAALFSLEMQ